ncbi:aminotransferase class III-fold pyridoxal phosphate-dependent enzyme [Mesorhizobium sp. M1027]|uniref:aminotransferase class III-fold pyridoxal phosphate-dependent enzyme n=1 Tax=Mesorhizobium sp. M1027 TaxID=2957050 RepID=UPI00333BE90F
MVKKRTPAQSENGRWCLWYALSILYPESIGGQFRRLPDHLGSHWAARKAPRAPPEFIRGQRALCDAHGIVLIADEVPSGLTRTGRVFVIQGVEAVALGKSFGGGLPIAAVISEAVTMDAVPPGGLAGTYAPPLCMHSGTCRAACSL